MTQPYRFPSVLLTLLLFASSAVAQPAAEVPAEPAPQPSHSLPEGLSDVGRQALQKWQQEGDVTGVIDLLEKQRQAGTATPVDMAVLGTAYMQVGRGRQALEIFRPLAEQEPADPAVLFNAGRAALSVGDVRTAESYLERSVRQIPDSPAARELGLLRGNQGRLVDAYQLLRPWVARNMGDLQARSALILVALKLGRAVEIESLFEGLPEDHPRTLLLRGYFLSETGKPKEAIEVLEPLVESHPLPMRNDLFTLLSDAYLTVGRSGDVVRLLEQDVAMDPRLAETLSQALEREGDLDGALETLKPYAERALADGKLPNAGQLLLDYGRYLVLQSRAEEALPYLEKTTELSPGDKVAWKSLGEAYGALGRRDEARAALERFRDLTHGDIESKQRAEAAVKDPGARALMTAFDAFQQGDGEKALELLQQEIDLSPRDPRPRIFQVNLLLKLERAEEALAKADETLEIFPGVPDALYQRGVVHMALQAPDKAEADFRQVLAKAPEHTGAMNDLAVLLIYKGQRPEARQLLERVLELMPDNQVARDNLERLQVQQ